MPRISSARGQRRAALLALGQPVLSEPNIDPDFLAALTSISVNKRVYKPTTSEIKDMYFKLYRGKGAEASVTSDAAGSCASPKGSSSGAGPSTIEH